MRFCYLLALCLLTPTLAVAQQGTIRVLIEVRDAETNEPLIGAQVATDSVARVTNLDGRVLFRGVAPGETHIAAAYVGYAPLDTLLDISTSSRISFLLTPRPFNLQEVEVSADRFNAARLERSGFYRRRDTRAGTFKTIEDLEKTGAVVFSDIFRSTAGLRIESQFGQTRLVSNRRRDCSPAIFFDGIAARDLALSLESVPLDGVLAVEIYRGPSEVPAEFAASANQTECGAVLVWTRAR